MKDAAKKRKWGGWPVDAVLVLGIIATLAAVFFSPPVFNPVKNHFAQKRLAAVVEEVAPNYGNAGGGMYWANMQDANHPIVLSYQPHMLFPQSKFMREIETSKSKYYLYSMLDINNGISLDINLTLEIHDILMDGDALVINYYNNFDSIQNAREAEDGFARLLERIVRRYDQH